MRIDSVCGGRPAIPTCRPTSNVSNGPSGFPMLILWPSRMSIIGTRRPLAKVPFSEPLSIASQRPWSKRSNKCAREISGCVMRMSARRSRPTTTSWPAANVRSEPSCRTVSAGGAGGVIGPTVARSAFAAFAANDVASRQDRRLAVSGATGRAPRSRRSGCAGRWWACTGCNACTPNALGADRCWPRSG